MLPIGYSSDADDSSDGDSSLVIHHPMWTNAVVDDELRGISYNLNIEWR